jgi:hypothetical protein
MSNWDFDKSSGNGKKAEFTKFPQGITRIHIVDEEPAVRWVHWMPQFKRSINCPGKGCPICEIRHQQKANKQPYTYQMGRRLAINIYNYETGKVEICEQGVTFFQDLRDIMEDLKSKGKHLSDVNLKVRRRGTTKDDTSYRIDVLTDEENEGLALPDSIIEDKIDLKDYFKPHTEDQILRLVQGESWEEVMKRNDEEDNTEEPIVLR